MTYTTHICNIQEAHRADKSTIPVDISHFSEHELKTSDSGSGLAASISRAPLGTKAKSSTPPPENRRAIRKDRYELSHTSRSIIAAEGSRLGLPYVLNYHRAARCSYIEIGDVAVHKSKKYNSAFFTGLTTCGSVWACPNCAAKVQERRREEIAKGMDHMHSILDSKGKCVMKAVMITLTFPHGRRDDLSKLLEKQKEAFKKFRHGGPWDRLRAACGYDSLIRSLEVTYGDNGWHPHTHELWFVRADADVVDMKRRIVKQWKAACVAVGLLDLDKRNAEVNFEAHAVDIKDNARTSDYLAKQDDSKHWGADREIAKASTKQGRKSGVHPFMFLTNYKESGEAKWARRWIEYIGAFKGKAQLYWTPKLKARCGIKVLKDKALAELKEDDALKIYELTLDEWRKVRNSNQQAKILDLCEQTSSQVVIEAVIAHLAPATAIEEIVSESVESIELAELTGADMSDIDHDVRREMAMKTYFSNTYYPDWHLKRHLSTQTAPVIKRPRPVQEVESKLDTLLRACD